MRALVAEDQAELAGCADTTSPARSAARCLPLDVITGIAPPPGGRHAPKLSYARHSRRQYASCAIKVGDRQPPLVTCVSPRQVGYWACQIDERRSSWLPVID